MSTSLVVAVGVVSGICGAAVQHWVSAVREWWRPSPCPAASSPDISAAELRTWQDASLVSHLATGISVSSVVALTLVSIYIAASFHPRSEPRAAPALPGALTPAAAAAPLQENAIEPQRFNLARDDDLDALELDEAALCSYVPQRRR